MQCQALTNKGIQCRNPAVIRGPHGDLICCRIASHITSTQPPVTFPTVPKVPLTPIVRKVPAKVREVREQDILEDSRNFLAYKAELTGILTDAFNKGFSSTNDHIKAIEYLKKRFPLGIYRVVKQKLTEGLATLEETQNKLIKALQLHPHNEKLVVTLNYYRAQADQTYRLLATLINLFEGGGGGGDMIRLLQEFDFQRLKDQELLASLPAIPSTELVMERPQATKVAVALKK